MQHIVRVIRDNKLARHNAVFFAGAMAVGALNYLYYPVLARLVAPSVFGEIQTLVSLFLQFGVLLTVLSMVIVNITINNGSDVRNALIFELEKLAVLACGAICLGAVLFGRQLQELLQFEHAAPFAMLGLALVASVPLYIRGAYLRGLERFGLMSASNIAAAGGKLLLSAALVAVGLGTIGAIGGIFAAQLAACALVGWWAYQHGLRQTAARRRMLRLPDFTLIAPELRYGGVVLIASLAITLQYSIDVIIIKHLFDPATAGLYAGLSAVARIPFFLTASIAQVLLSKIRLKGGDHNRRTLKQSLLLLIGLCLPVLGAFAMFPSPIMHILVGGEYGAMASLLLPLAASACIVAILNLLAAYYLSLRRYGIAAITAAGALFTYFLIFLHHGSPAAIVESLLIGSAATLAAAGAWQLTERRSGV